MILIECPIDDSFLVLFDLLVSLRLTFKSKYLASDFFIKLWAFYDFIQSSFNAYHETLNETPNAYLNKRPHEEGYWIEVSSIDFEINSKRKHMFWER